MISTGHINLWNADSNISQCNIHCTFDNAGLKSSHSRTQNDHMTPQAGMGTIQWCHHQTFKIVNILLTFFCSKIIDLYES